MNARNRLRRIEKARPERFSGPLVCVLESLEECKNCPYHDECKAAEKGPLVIMYEKDKKRK
jgi:hypothetical protein